MVVARFVHRFGIVEQYFCVAHHHEIHRSGTAVAVVDAVVEVLDKEIAATPIIGGGKVYPSGALVDTWPGGAVMEDGLVKPRIAVGIGILLVVSRRRIVDGAMIGVITGDGLGVVVLYVYVYQHCCGYGCQ